MQMKVTRHERLLLIKNFLKSDGILPHVREQLILQRSTEATNLEF